MNKILQEILDVKIISIIRGVSSQNILPAVEALYKGGIRFVEVTYKQGDDLVSEDTLQSIQLLKDKFSGSMHIGAGTVLTSDQVEKAMVSGAEFIISPNMNPAVIQRTKALGMISMPGAYTPTEAEAAWENGADIVKIFPADQLGPAYFKAVKAPLPQLRLAAVGGVSEQNIDQFLSVGVDCFGIASNLVNSDRVERGAWNEIFMAAKKYMQIVKQYQG